MLYVQFYQPNAMHQREVVQASGDRSVIVYDGRGKPGKWYADAREECIQRGYAGFRFFRGETFSRSVPEGPYHGLPVYYVCGVDAEAGQGRVVFMTQRPFFTPRAAQEYALECAKSWEAFVVEGAPLPLAQGEQ